MKSFHFVLRPDPNIPLRYQTHLPSLGLNYPDLKPKYQRWSQNSCKVKLFIPSSLLVYTTWSFEKKSQVLLKLGRVVETKSYSLVCALFSGDSHYHFWALNHCIIGPTAFFWSLKKKVWNLPLIQILWQKVKPTALIYFLQNSLRAD